MWRKGRGTSALAPCCGFPVRCNSTRSSLLYSIRALQNPVTWSNSHTSFRPQTRPIHDSKKPVLITTPIFYVNGPPHIGHLYSALLADALARWYRLLGDRTLFSTGTDEHGMKVEAAAKAKDMSTQQFCDDISQEFRRLFNKAEISYDDFIRTTEERHKWAVEKMWRTLVEKNFVYLGQYEGWYCLSDEAFLTPSQVIERVDEKTGSVTRASAESGNKVEWVTEENYKFKLSAFQDQLICWVEEKNPIIPRQRQQDVLNILKGAPLHDLSVSRVGEKTKWGIRVPENENHTIYVWLDALTNYLTVTGYPQWDTTTTSNNNSETCAWPADYHIIGKDILKFHCIYWPAFLMAAGLPLPQKIVSHAHWTRGRMKMSKSLGNVVSPHDAIDTYGLDPIRYFLLKEGGIVDDGDFSDLEIVSKLNADLADNLGNLFARITSPTINPAGVIPPCGTLTPEDNNFIDNIKALPGKVDNAYRVLDFKTGLDEIMSVLQQTNKYFQDNQPWRLLKTDQKPRAETVFYVASEAARVSALLLQPIMPRSAAKMLDMLGVPTTERGASFFAFGRQPGATLTKDILFVKKKT